MESSNKLEIRLPWFPSILSPNARSHWAKKDKARSQYNHSAFYVTKALPPELRAKAQHAAKIQGKKIPLKITFYPPTKARRDIDNCLASIKAGLDGIASALGVDDIIFRPLLIDMGEPVKEGKVLIELNLA